MKCLDYGAEIKEELEGLRVLHRRQARPLAKRRLKFLLALKSGQCPSQAAAGKQIGIGRRASEKLWKLYVDEGLEGILRKPCSGHPPKLSQAAKNELDRELDQSGVQTLKQACAFVRRQHGISISEPGMFYYFKTCGVKKKTARPTNIKKDEQGETDFKKKLFPALKQRYGEALYFEDEMRTGTRTECKTRWSRKGHRPVCRVKLGYEFCYLYCALCPALGHLICLLLPDMTKASFGLFCAYFSEQVAKFWKEAEVLMVCDGAGAHQKEVCLVHGIALQRLPTACPELNPVERFFEELRKEMSNQVYQSIEAVENHLSKILQPYFTDKNKIINLCHYDYIRTQ